uniref:Uncharacterized protein n=1 Tax=Octopus bimaculoides TaxID=37653 RepID=A0A0L8HR64_OCTBM
MRCYSDTGLTGNQQHFVDKLVHGSVVSHLFQTSNKLDNGAVQVGTDVCQRLRYMRSSTRSRARSLPKFTEIIYLTERQRQPMSKPDGQASSNDAHSDEMISFPNSTVR